MRYKQHQYSNLSRYVVLYSIIHSIKKQLLPQLLLVDLFYYFIIIIIIVVICVFFMYKHMTKSESRKFFDEKCATLSKNAKRGQSSRTSWNNGVELFVDGRMPCVRGSQTDDFNQFFYRNKFAVVVVAWVNSVIC